MESAPTFSNEKAFVDYMLRPFDHILIPDEFEPGHVPGPLPYWTEVARQVIYHSRFTLGPASRLIRPPKVSR